MPICHYKIDKINFCYEVRKISLMPFNDVLTTNIIVVIIKY